MIHFYPEARSYVGGETDLRTQCLQENTISREMSTFLSPLLLVVDVSRVVLSVNWCHVG